MTTLRASRATVVSLILAAAGVLTLGVLGLEWVADQIAEVGR